VQQRSDGAYPDMFTLTLTLPDAPDNASISSCFDVSALRALLRDFRMRSKRVSAGSGKGTWTSECRDSNGGGGGARRRDGNASAWK